MNSKNGLDVNRGYIEWGDGHMEWGGVPGDILEDCIHLLTSHAYYTNMVDAGKQVRTRHGEEVDEVNGLKDARNYYYVEYPIPEMDRKYYDSLDNLKKDLENTGYIELEDIITPDCIALFASPINLLKVKKLYD